MKNALPLLAAMFLVFPAQAGAQTRVRTLACKSNSYGLDDFNSRISVPSPDRVKRVLLANDGSFRVFERDLQTARVVLPEINSNVQVVWSPDSNKFSITYSDGGAEGGYHAHLYLVRNRTVLELVKPPRTAFDDFRKRYYCTARGDNIYSLGWTADSGAVFFLTAVYDTSDCGSIEGKASGYLVSLEGKLLAGYTGKQTMAIGAKCRTFGRATLPATRTR